MTTRFVWGEGAHCTSDAQAAGEMCAELESRGALTAKNLVDANRPEDAPLHNEFEWDDTKAAEKYREDQARYIIRSLKVVNENETERDDCPVRAYYKVDTDSSNYDAVSTIVQSEDKYNALLRIALNELRSFQRKYRQIKELSDIFRDIDVLLNGKAV